jgi:hypothetical protein
MIILNCSLKKQVVFKSLYRNQERDFVNTATKLQNPQTREIDLTT